MLSLPRSERLVFFESLAVIVGTIVGAGIFAIPYVVAQVGFSVGMVFVIALGLVVMALNVLLGEIVARTKGSFQLTGLAGKYLGAPGKAFMGVSVFVGAYGALLAYTIGVGEALASVFGGESMVWSILFLAVGGFFLYRGLKTVKVVELIMTSALFVLVIVFVLWVAPDIQFTHYGAAPNWTYLFLPYGVILFAYHGSSSIAVAHAVVRRHERLFRPVIVLASLIPIALYALFTAAVVGVTGPETTEVATVGLGAALGPVVLIAGNVFAFFAMATSFLIIGTALRETYEWDFRWPPVCAWAAVLAAPLVLFLAGVRSFVGVIGFVGALSISVEVILVVLMYWKVQREGDYSARRFHVRYAPVASVVLLVVFALAAVYSLWEFFV